MLMRPVIQRISSIAIQSLPPKISSTLAFVGGAAVAALDVNPFASKTLCSVSIPLVESVKNNTHTEMYRIARQITVLILKNARIQDLFLIIVGCIREIVWCRSIVPFVALAAANPATTAVIATATVALISACLYKYFAAKDTDTQHKSTP